MDGAGEEKRNPNWKLTGIFMKPIGMQLYDSLCLDMKSWES